MARWPTGAKAVEFLLDRGKLEGLGDADLGAATEVLLARATRRLGTAAAALDGEDVEGAYAAAYDAYRISAEALLIRQGLRATGGEGSHMTVEDVVGAQFADRVAGFAKPTFERLRRTRHLAQYFDPAEPPIERADAEWAIEVSRETVAAVERLLRAEPPDRFFE